MQNRVGQKLSVLYTALREQSGSIETMTAFVDQASAEAAHRGFPSIDVIFKDGSSVLFVDRNSDGFVDSQGGWDAKTRLSESFDDSDFNGTTDTKFSSGTKYLWGEARERAARAKR
jgi:hypothetical protein